VLCVKKAFHRKERKVKPRKERKEKAIDLFLPLIRIKTLLSGGSSKIHSSL
jgi:hypothetical protein